MTLFFNIYARSQRAAWQEFVTKYYINLFDYQNNFVEQYKTGGLFGFIERDKGKTKTKHKQNTNKQKQNKTKRDLYDNHLKLKQVMIILNKYERG